MQSTKFIVPSSRSISENICFFVKVTVVLVELWKSGSNSKVHILARVIVLCSLARFSTLMLLISTQEYKRVKENCQETGQSAKETRKRNKIWQNSIPSRGRSNALGPFWKLENVSCTSINFCSFLFKGWDVLLSDYTEWGKIHT